MKRKNEEEVGGRKGSRQEGSLNDDSSVLRKAEVLSSLCKSELSASPDIVNVALELLRGADARLRMWALKFLVTKGSLQPKQLSNLVCECSFDPRACVREAALSSAILINYNGDEDIAFRLLQDGSLSIRLSAINLVGLQVKSRDNVGVDYAYLQLCTVLTGMSWQEKEQACLVLGDMECVSENVVLHSLNKRSQLAPAGIMGNDKQFPAAKIKTLLESGAGAFIQALEDEFFQVRTAAIQALVKLATSKNIVDIISELFFDLTSDQNVVIREVAIQALSQIIKSLTLRDKHVNMTFRFMDDSCKEVRSAGRKLLSSMVLPAVKTVKTALQMLLSSLPRYPEDKEEVLSTLHSLGKSHSHHLQHLLKDTLLNQMMADDLDDSRLEPLVTFCMGAEESSRNIASLLPQKIMQRWTHLASLSERRSCIPDSASTVQHVLDHAISSKSLSSPEEKLKQLRNCRLDLKLLKGGPPASLAILYVEFLSLVINLTTGNKSRDQLYARLGMVLGEMRHRFSGLGPDGMAQLLEMEAFHAIFGGSDGLSRLSSVVTEWHRMVASGNISEPGGFPLLQEAEKQLPVAGGHVILETLSQTFWPRHNLVRGKNIRQMWVEVEVPESDPDNRLKFIAGLPFQVKVTGVIHCLEALNRQRLWVEMDFKGFPQQYRLLDNLKMKETTAGKDVSFAENVEYFKMPEAALGILRVSILVEISFGTGNEPLCLRGPTAGHCVEVSSEKLMYLSRAHF